MALAAHFAFLVLTVASLAPVKALAQGETTSAIVGQVWDTPNAVVPGAIVTITNPETGLRRSAKTDDSGRFSESDVTLLHLVLLAFGAKSRLPGYRLSLKPRTSRLNPM
jgi:hypothetical protein